MKKFLKQIIVGCLEGYDVSERVRAGVQPYNATGTINQVIDASLAKLVACKKDCLQVQGY
jgi:hypothetical protein